MLEKWAHGEGTKVPSQIIPRRSEYSPAPLSFAQEWYFYHPVNEPAAILVEGLLNAEVLERAFNDLIRRHETLRTTYSLRNGTPVQHIASTYHLKLPLESLDVWPESERFERGIQQLNAEVTPLHLDLEHGPILFTKLL